MIEYDSPSLQLVMGLLVMVVDVVWGGLGGGAFRWSRLYMLRSWTWFDTSCGRRRRDRRGSDGTGNGSGVDCVVVVVYSR